MVRGKWHPPPVKGHPSPDRDSHTNMTEDLRTSERNTCNTPPPCKSKPPPPMQQSTWGQAKRMQSSTVQQAAWEKGCGVSLLPRRLVISTHGQQPKSAVLIQPRQQSIICRPRHVVMRAVACPCADAVCAGVQLLDLVSSTGADPRVLVAPQQQHWRTHLQMPVEPGDHLCKGYFWR